MSEPSTRRGALPWVVLAVGIAIIVLLWIPPPRSEAEPPDLPAVPLPGLLVLLAVGAVVLLLGPGRPIVRVAVSGALTSITLAVWLASHFLGM